MSSGMRFSRDAFGNAFEHLFTRTADALLSLFLIWTLEPEVFSRLALAQAWFAPALFFFICPENIYYRDFARFREEGREAFHRRLRIFRVFGLLKFPLAFGIALAISALAPADNSQRLPALVWAFSWGLAPQFMGADRTFLRLNLSWRSLNALTLLQKITLLGFTAVAIRIAPESLWGIAFASLASGALSILAGIALSERSLRASGFAVSASAVTRPEPAFSVLRQSFHDFSFWNHVSGIVYGWTQTLDVFCLGLIGLPFRQIGLYSAVIKFANFTLALPQGFSNLFNIWLGRKKKEADSQAERGLARKWTGFLGAALVAQALVFYAFAPEVFTFLSRGRWSAEERILMMQWLAPILAVPVGISALSLLENWIAIRVSARRFVTDVSIPWILLSFGGVYALVWKAGIFGGAVSNLWVLAVYSVLLLRLWRKTA